MPGAAAGGSPAERPGVCECFLCVRVRRSRACVLCARVRARAHVRARVRVACMECACACVCAWRTAGIADEARPTVGEVSATVSGSPASPPGGLGDVDLDPMALDSTPPPQPSDTNPAPSSAIRGRAGGVEG
jgi:hypothetical protein